MSDVVYVIGAEASDTIKIGVSNQPTRRLREIQFMSPVPLAILWSNPGSYDLERCLHSRFAKYRSHGEWFTFPFYSPPVKTIKAVATALEFSVDQKGKLSPWPDAPTCGEENRHYWLSRRLREALPDRSFTFAEAAEEISAPPTFVEKYGRKLAASGSIVEQTVTRNGQRVYWTAWDDDGRWAPVGVRPERRVAME